MKKKLFIFIIIFCLFNVPAHISKATETKIERIKGQDRFEVAANVAKKGWPNNAKKVFLVNYNAFADALAVAPLAYKENSPILLTHSNKLTDVTESEIKRLKPDTVVLVGGEGSISSHVYQQLLNMNVKAERIEGKDRFEVSSRIADHFKNSSEAIIANGFVFADALSIAPYAARKGMPILLTAPDRLPDMTRLALAGKKQTLVVGGEASVGAQVYNQLPGKMRIGGKNRFEVGVNIIKEMKLDTSTIFMSTGLSFADALTGSILAAKQNAPLLLSMPDKLPEETIEIILEGKTTHFVVLGGPASIHESILASLIPITNSHSIEGYSDKISYFPGETIQLKVHSPNGKFSLNVLKYGRQVMEIKSIENIVGYSQNYLPDAYENGARWKTTYEFKIPENWKSGMYAAKLYDGKSESYITFILKNRNPAKQDIAVLSSTNTWQAYNEWGGKSLYSYNMVNGKPVYSEIVSFARPNPAANPTGNAGHLANGERHVLSWLESENYHYNLFADKDLDENPGILNSYKVLIINTHSEYWTQKMYNNLQAFLKKGGTLLYLSGNGIYWKAALYQDQIEVKKNGGIHRFTNERGGNFSVIGMPETRILGVRYQSSGFSIPSPYKVEVPSHWIFTGTGLKKGDLIGERGLNTVLNSTGGASGWETDQMDKYTPTKAVLLARGTNKNGAGAHMVYYDHPGGGGVFSAGSITFGGSLAIDRNLTKMVVNIIERFNK